MGWYGRRWARVFCEILGNAGVFKDTEEGREAFGRFCQQVNRSL